MRYRFDLPVLFETPVEARPKLIGSGTPPQNPHGSHADGWLFRSGLRQFLRVHVPPNSRYGFRKIIASPMQMQKFLQT